MPTGTYEAVSHDNKSVSGRIDAGSEHEALVMIRQVGMSPTRVREQDAGGNKATQHSAAATRTRLDWEEYLGAAVDMVECGFADCQCTNPSFAQYCARCGRQTSGSKPVSVGNSALGFVVVAVAYGLIVLDMVAIAF